jgi:hypothetical protein
LNYLLKHYGYDSAKTLEQRVIAKIAAQGKSPDGSSERAVEYFEHDFE